VCSASCGARRVNGACASRLRGGYPVDAPTIAAFLCLPDHAITLWVCSPSRSGGIPDACWASQSDGLTLGVGALHEAEATTPPSQRPFT
jgi:hypothetical protein